MASAQVHKGFFLDEENLNVELGNILPEDRSVNWDCFLQKMKARTPHVVSQITKQLLDVHPKREAYQLFGVLTADECAYLIDATEAIGYQKLKGYAQQYRSNTRRIIHYEDLRNVLWERVKDFLTPTLEAPSRGSEWKMYGLNPQFRFCRYEPGQKFAAHYDGNYMVSSEDRSFYTFMIYLNGGFDGGATNFLSDSTRPPRNRVLASLAPEPGMLLVFQHDIFHEGEALQSGLKYMMRTDVMYRLEGAKSDEDRAHASELREAHDLLNLAEQYEAQGKHAQSIEYYKKAYKLAPQLAHKDAAALDDEGAVPSSSSSS